MKINTYLDKFKKESGQVLVLAALLMTVLMGFAAFAVDIGRVAVVKSHLQNAADAAALAGAAAYDEDPEGTAENVLNFNGIFDSDPSVKKMDILLLQGFSGPGETVPAYDDDELEQMEEELLEELRDITKYSDLDLIELADDYGINIGNNVVGSGDKRVFKSGGKTKEEIRNDIKEELYDKSDKDLLDLAENNGLERSDYYQNKNNPDIIKNNKKQKLIDDILNTPAYIELINNEFNTQDGTNHREIVINKIVQARINELRAQEIPVGGSNRNSKRVKVTLKKEISYTFARILGFDDTVITVNAVAENKSQWDGESLPFINIAFDYSTTDPSAWTHVGPGVKGTITDFYVRNGGSPNVFYEVDYEDGITIDKGFSNPTGLNGIKLRTYLDDVITKADKGVKKFFIFSLRADVIKSGQFTVNNKAKTVGINNLNNLKNGDIIDPDQLVLIECLFIDCKWANLTDIQLKFLGPDKVYDLGNNDPDNDLPDFPTNNLSSTGGKSILVQ